jgi:CDP-diacylglycerol---glycerol-3-phosphate 3-phosphatidyltransferase
MANLITAARVVLLFVTIGFVYLSLPGDRGAPGEPWWAVVAAVLTFVVFVSDALDGMVARARGETNEFGAVVDIAGDRVVENVYWVVFAHLGMISVWFPLLMLVRSFFVDAVRSLALSKGKTAFGEKTMMQSKFGTWLAASRFNRAVFGAAKVVTFIWLLLQLALQIQIGRDAGWAARYGDALGMIQGIGIGLAVFTLLYSLARGAVVIWDSRHELGVVGS